jgi:hypothetical protein
MCYFLAVGAVSESWGLCDLLERELWPEVDAISAPPDVEAAFPREDTVRLMIHDGCSCKLFEPASRRVTRGWTSPDVVRLSWHSRRALAAAVTALGKLRIYVRCRQAVTQHRPRLAMTLAELMAPGSMVYTHVLIEILREVPPSSLA